MKILKGIIVVVVLFLFLYAAQSVFGEKFNAKASRQATTITWEYVNMREGASTAERVITQIQRGERVILTGNEFNYFGGDGSATDYWVEIEFAGYTGWIVRSAIK